MSTRNLDPLSLPLSGLQLIEASAGTGKTFNLAGLYLRLIVERHASVRDILVMTFTRAAAQELRERIRRRLVDAARIAADRGAVGVDHQEHRFARDVLAACPDAPAAIARRLANAAAAVDEATIVTIHGFAQRAAADNAFNSALAFDRGENVDDRRVFAQAGADVWRRAVFGHDGRPDLLAVWPTPDALVNDVMPILSHPGLRVDGADPARLDAALKALWPQWQREKEALGAALDNVLANDAFKKSALKTLLTGFAAPAAFIADLDRRLEQAFRTGEPPILAAALEELADPASFLSRGSNAKKACAEPFEKLGVPALLADLVEPARVIHTTRTAEAVRALAEARKIEWRQFSYDDLVLGLHAALTHPEHGPRLAGALRAQWPYALVDEFQDTDPVQYASLARIYLDGDSRTSDATTLLLIGDPKQAIYAFRGGDIYAYLVAARAAGDRQYTLGTNFRSSQRVLDAVAALFQWPQDTPFLESGIAFPAVTAGRKTGDRRLVIRRPATASAREQPALTVWRLTDGKGTKDDDNAPIVQHTVATIARLLAGEAAWTSDDPQWDRPVAARDIAVLVNNGREATTIQTALAEHGIAAVCQRRDSIFITEEAAELALLLTAMAQPDDPVAVRSAETTRLAGARLADLIHLADDDNAMQACVTRYHAHYDNWRRRGILAALEAVFITAAPAILTLTDGERRMSNYLQLAEWLAAAEPECYGMTGLVHRLDREIAAARKAEGRAESDQATQLRLESDDALVRITTVHSAKGLEYPIVFMPYALYLGAPTKNRDPGKPPFIYHDITSHEPDRARIDLTGAGHISKDRAVLEAHSEALRLLYVGLTRAADALFIIWREPGDGSSKSAGNGARDGALHNLLGRNGSVASALAAMAAQYPGTVALESINVAEPLRVPIPSSAPRSAAAPGPGRSELPAARTPWSSWSFSRLAHAPSDQNAAQAPMPGAEDEWATPEPVLAAPSDDAPLPLLDRSLAGVRFGSAVHDLLEYAVVHGWPAPDMAADDGQQRQTAETLRRYGLIGDDDHDPRVAQTAGVVARTLSTPLPDLGPLSAIAPTRLRAEMDFLLGLGDQRLQTVIDSARAAGYLRTPLGRWPEQSLNGLLQGFIDLVVEVDGTYWILDYKTNRLGDTRSAYRPEALNAAISASHYDLQYLLYSVALHRHLGRCLGSRYAAERHLGGVQYLFVRALDGATDSGIFVDHPPPSLIRMLDRLFDNPGAQA